MAWLSVGARTIYPYLHLVPLTESFTANVYDINILVDQSEHIWGLIDLKTAFEHQSENFIDILIENI